MKVLMLGDSPFLTTGFGRVQRNAMEAFLTKGWEVATVTALQTTERETTLPVKQFVPTTGDNLGLLRVADAVTEFEPDVIYATGEDG